MRPQDAFKLTLALALIPITSTAAEATGDRVVTDSVILTAGQDVSIEFPVGELTVLSTDGDELTASLQVRCKRRDCGSLPDRIALDIDSSAGKVRIDVDGYPRWWGKSKLDLEATIEVPRGREVDVEMGVGEVEIDGVGGDLSVELGVGDIDLRLPEPAIRSVSLEAGVGDASIEGTESLALVERHFVGASVEWRDGVGDATVVAEVGVGDVSAHLTGSE